MGRSSSRFVVSRYHTLITFYQCLLHHAITSPLCSIKIQAVRLAHPEAYRLSPECTACSQGQKTSDGKNKKGYLLASDPLFTVLLGDAVIWEGQFSGSKASIKVPLRPSTQNPKPETRTSDLGVGVRKSGFGMQC